MDKVFIGKIVNTHGIKGEIRIKSDFDRKELIFKPGQILIVNDEYYKINTYRIHKNYDMVTFEGYDNINQILDLVGNNVFINRDTLALDDNDYIYSDLLNMEIILYDISYGEVIDYTNTQNPLLIVKNNEKKYYIPLNGNFITKVDKKNGKIYVSEDVKGFII